MSRRRAAAGVLVAVALLTACPGPDPDPPAGPTSAGWVPQECPPDVETQVVPQHVCGWVTAPLGEDEQRLFVVVVEPPTPSDEPPVLETGTDLGMTPNYGGLAPIAQRTGRRTVIVDMPGTGHSVPSLDCPEVDEVGDVPVDAPRLLDAVTGCRERLAADGLDPALMTPSRSASALLAVMDAIGSEQWVLMAHGTTAVTAVQVAREHPDRVEALVLDSPLQAQGDWASRRAAVVRGVAASCAAGPACAERHGDVRALWRAAWDRARRAPVEMGSVALDRALLDRAVRWIAAPATGATRLPALLEEAASGQKGLNLYELQGLLPAAPPLCVGLLPKCHGQDQELALGAVLTSICPEASGGPDFAAVCGRWGMGADPAVAAPVRGVPTLVLLGEHDPFASPDAAAADARQQVPGAYVVVVPGLGHNVLGEECPRTVRNEWLAGPLDEPPPEPACLARGLVFS